jgi:hypothetical protein
MQDFDEETSWKTVTCETKKIADEQSQQLARLKQSKKIFEAGFSWMKEILDFSFCQRKKLLK